MSNFNSKWYASSLVLVIGAMMTTVGNTQSSRSLEKKKKLNILWIISDDLSPDIGCYGGKAVFTPNLDALAESGIRFTNAFATSPVCSPSRSALVTGVFQTTLGVHHHRTRAKKQLPPGYPTVMKCFRDAGYFVSHVGKTDYNFISDCKFDGRDWTERGAGQSFFAQVQISEPHRSFALNKDANRPAKIELPPYYPDHPVMRADWANYLASVEILDAKVGEILERLKAEGIAQDTVVFFFGDHGRPQVWDKQWLNDGGIQVPLLVRVPNGAGGQVENKLVSLIDIAPTSLALAGIPVPKSMWGADLFNEKVPVPAMVFAARDRTGDAFDRIRCVRTSEFKYIRNYHPELSYSTRSSYKTLMYPGLALIRVLHSRGELTPVQARYMANEKPREELYDLGNDPFEIANLADDPSHAETLLELSQSLDQWEVETNDLGRVPEMTSDDLAKLIQSKREWFTDTMRERGFKSNHDPEEYLEWWSRKLGVVEDHK